jgi:hypothetical protein
MMKDLREEITPMLHEVIAIATREGIINPEANDICVQVPDAEGNVETVRGVTAIQLQTV